MIDRGSLCTFLHNSYTARKSGVRSTGNASRGDIKAPPSVGPTNLYIEPGKESGDPIMKRVTKGLYITKVMGMHTINPISGEFSIGAAGILIENGERTRGIRGITIAGTLLDFLQHIEAVGSDLRWVASIAAPTLLISGIQVAGSGQ